MSTGRPVPERIRNAVVDDYRTSGDAMSVVAARHGVSKTALASWVNPSSKKREPKTYGADEIALTGGRWVNVRGVMRWEAFVPIPKDDLSAHERRVKAEEEMFTEEDAKAAHARYAYGHRDSHTVVGERVYNRRKKRRRTAEKATQEVAA